MSSAELQICLTFLLISATLNEASKEKRSVDLKEYCTQICSTHYTEPSFNPDTNTCVCHKTESKSVNLGPMGWKLLMRRSAKIGLNLEVVDNSNKMTNSLNVPFNDSLSKDYKLDNMANSVLGVPYIPLLPKPPVKHLLYPLIPHNPIIAAKVMQMRTRMQNFKLRQRNSILGITKSELKTESSSEAPKLLQKDIKQELLNSEQNNDKLKEPKDEKLPSHKIIVQPKETLED